MTIARGRVYDDGDVQLSNVHGDTIYVNHKFIKPVTKIKGEVTQDKPSNPYQPGAGIEFDEEVF